MLEYSNSQEGAGMEKLTNAVVHVTKRDGVCCDRVAISGYIPRFRQLLNQALPVSGMRDLDTGYISVNVRKVLESIGWEVNSFSFKIGDDGQLSDLVFLVSEK
jgi:hypothetical protein